MIARAPDEGKKQATDREVATYLLAVLAEAVDYWVECNDGDPMPPWVIVAQDLVDAVRL